MEPVTEDPADVPVDRLLIKLRAYSDAGRARGGRGKERWESGVVVVFDTETLADPSQRLRFGAYQVREHGALRERGLFYADDLDATDMATLHSAFAAERDVEGEPLFLRPVAEFIDEVFFGWGLDVGGMVVGFNLPFDISRLAIDHSYSKRKGRKREPGEADERGAHSFAGGFSFTLAPNRPRVRVKHLSQRSALISLAGKSGYDHKPDRGFFTDVKTLAAALTGRSFSLGGLAKVLGTTPKGEFDDFEGPITREMVRYGINDVQVTWECFERLSGRYADYKLKAGLNELYSEASLGKAFLQAMNVRPWREVQPDFPPEILGQIMSAYFGGRAEVRIRRQITPVIHCDFLSMYPTVCTLMGLWHFVIAEGVTWRDATEEVRALLDEATPESLAQPDRWRELTCLVRVKADDDVFPVRANYGPSPDEPSTIGLNRMTADEPMWFALPDVLASKLLTGKAPEIVSAVRFDAKAPQAELRDITFADATIRPAQNDFYKLVIEERRRVQAKEKAAEGDQQAALNAQQQGLKILANSTSYGIFVEINVEQLDRAKAVEVYDFRGVGRKVRSDRVERPGRYFHPLLGTLITSAARLMLALAERGVADEGLGWVFCDTDSISIAQPEGMPTAEFLARVERVRGRFAALNPYEAKGPILQLEKVNYPEAGPRDASTLRPLSCLAISAKRYVQFDRDPEGRPVIRKGSQHGLGHLLPPYEEGPAARTDRLGRSSLELWQEDLWQAIIAAFDHGDPDQVDYEGVPNFERPAASRYAATNQALLKWFERYNAEVGERDRVRPFNFLLSYQSKSRLEMEHVDPEALHTAAWQRGRSPKPASRYARDLSERLPPIFDRTNGEAVPPAWLKTYARSLVRHHMHAESKFRNADGADRGATQRRAMYVLGALAIGKEADNLDDRETLGERDEELTWALGTMERDALICELKVLQTEYGVSDRELCAAAAISHHTLAAIRSGKRIASGTLTRVAHFAEQIRQAQNTKKLLALQGRFALQRLAARLGGRAALAKWLGLSPTYAGRLMSGERVITSAILRQLRSEAELALDT